MSLTHETDLLILGGGPAGMTAAIYAARANLRAIILESNITGGLVNSTYLVENFPSRPGIHGMTLMEEMRAHVDSLGVAVEEVCEVTELDLTGPVKRAVTDEAVFEAGAVILATGRRPIPLGTPTEAGEVHHCAICDGAAYKGRRVLVVGGGNSAFDESLYLLGLGVAQLTLVEVMDRFFAAEAAQKALLGDARVDARRLTRVHDLVTNGGRLTGAVLERADTGARETLSVDGVFVFLGQEPNNALFRGQVATSDAGYLLTDQEMRTNLPGVFGAGDIVDKPCRQITTAMADGTIAALAAERWLRGRG